MESFWQSNVDHVPELGVKGVLEHVQPLQEEICMCQKSENWFKIWSSGDVPCNVSKVGHQVVSLALLHCLGLPYWHYQLVLSWYLHQPESTQ